MWLHSLLETIAIKTFAYMLYHTMQWKFWACMICKDNNQMDDTPLEAIIITLWLQNLLRKSTPIEKATTYKTGLL